MNSYQLFVDEKGENKTNPYIIERHRRLGQGCQNSRELNVRVFLGCVVVLSDSERLPGL